MGYLKLLLRCGKAIPTPFHTCSPKRLSTLLESAYLIAGIVSENKGHLI